MTDSNSKSSPLTTQYKFSIVTADSPANDILASPYFSHLANLFYYGLRDLGYDVQFSSSPFGIDRMPIIFGAHLISELAAIPDNAVIFNSEQHGSPWFGENYIELLKKHFVIDYSLQNIDRLAELGIEAHHVRLGYVKEEDRALGSSTEVQKDIDVLFYGSLNQRRTMLLELLAVEDITVHVAQNIFGDDLDALIQRAKIVLNVHYYETKLFEIVRLNYLLSNGVCVISETGHDPLEKDYEEAVIFSDYEDLAETVMAALADQEKLQAQRDAANSFMRTRPQDRLLTSDFVPYVEDIGLSKMTEHFPTVINIGSGKDFNKFYLNLDILEETYPDIVYDITQPFVDKNLSFSTTRFGVIHLHENSIDTIVANDVLEHLPDLISAMTTCLHLLKYGGKMKIKVPYDLSYGAWQDPTHVRAFNEESWRYFTDWCWYIGWFEDTFRLASLLLDLHPIGVEMQNSGIDLAVIARTPRAVNSMVVELEKIRLDEDTQKRLRDFKQHRSFTP
jgi:hypothetical protein